MFKANENEQILSRLDEEKLTLTNDFKMKMSYRYRHWNRMKFCKFWLNYNETSFQMSLAFSSRLYVWQQSLSNTSKVNKTNCKSFSRSVWDTEGDTCCDWMIYRLFVARRMISSVFVVETSFLHKSFIIINDDRLETVVRHRIRSIE